MTVEGKGVGLCGVGERGRGGGGGVGGPLRTGGFSLEI